VAENKIKLGSLLLQAGLINEFQLNSALKHQKQWGERLASILIDLGFVDEKSVASVLEKQLKKRCIPLNDKRIPQIALKKVPPEIAQKYGIMPLGIKDDTLFIAISDPTDLDIINEISFKLNSKIKAILAIESSIRKAIHRHYWGITYGTSTPTINVKKVSKNMQIEQSEKNKHFNSYHTKIFIDVLLDFLTEKNVKEELTKKILKRMRNSKI
jgi:type IV pilus assembly protein PilB